MKKDLPSPTHDRIEGDKIFVDDKGSFPKKLIIFLESNVIHVYSLIRTKNGKYILN